MARLRLGFIALLAAVSLGPVAQAQVTPTGQTSVTNAPNGVPVVNIATPNAAGLSRNTYTSYNVGSGGLVLNNGAADALTHASQLAGQVLSNPNLPTSAKVILNEVTSTNRSVLAGYTEVAGGAADVIVSNPYGITCNGCGFINTPAVTLTTGTAQVNGSGALTGFAVNGGDILITGTGVNATAADYLAIVSRQIKLEAQVNGKTVDLIGGAGNWDYVNRNQSAAAGSTPKPQYAIDSTALGGVYAGKIRLISTEAGVGVRMLGEAAASGSDFSIDAAGAVVLNNKITAAQDVRIASTSTGADAVTISGGSQITAQRNLAVTAAGAATVDNATLNSGGAFTLNAGSYATGASGATLASRSTMALTTTGALALGSAAVSATGDLSLTSTGGNVSTTAATAQGVQSSTGAITITAANGFDNAGVVTADGGSVTLRVDGALNNSGAIHSKTSLVFTDRSGGGSETVTNSGKLVADGALTGSANAFNNAAAGQVQGANSSAITATAVANAGSIILGMTNGTSSLLSGGSIANTGRVESQGGLTVASGSGGLANTGGTILATGALTLQARDTSTTAISNDAAGLVQAGTTLSVIGFAGGANATLTNAGKMLGGTVALTTTTTANSGTIQSDGYFSGVFTDSLTNTGTLNTGADFDLLVANALNNAAGGVINATGGLKVRGTAASLSIADNGRMQAGTLTDIAAGSGGLAFTLGSAGVLTTNTLALTATSLALADGANLTSQGAATLNLGTLTMGGANAALIGSNKGGLTTITLANSLTNNGLIYSGGDMTLTAPAFYNSTTAGAGAKGTLNLTTPSQSGIIGNSGALYAGTSLNLVGFTITNQDAGTINSDQDATITADTFVNNNNVNVTRDLIITANTFHNDVAGGDDRYWTYAGTGFNPLSGSSCTAAGGPCGSTSGTEDYSLHLSQSYVGNLGGHYDNFSADFKVEQKYASGAAPTHKPQIRANNSLTIKDFTTGTNIGGVLSAPTITISSTKSGAAFNNDDMSLTTQYWHDTYGRYIDCYISFPGIDCDTGALGGYNKYITNATYVGFGAGVFAGTLNVTGVALTNTGSQADQAVARLYSNAFPVPTTTAGGALTATTASVSGTGATANSTTAAARAAFTGAITFGGLNLNLPANPNGIFVTVKDPSSSFLVESNPHFTSGDALGSDYLASHLGIAPETIQRRLGDANYESYLIGQQILAQTGNLVIARADTEQQQVQSLMDNALQVASDAGLQFGVTPTPEQLAKIDTDFVWMVPVTVDGQQVLAPMVYLSAKTKSQVETGAVIAANDATLDVTSLTNSGGTIEGSNSLTVTSKGDVTNTSGTIKGGDVKIASTEGSIVNQDLSATGVNAKQGTLKAASIQSTGTLSLDAAKDITVKGAQVNAGGDASLKAGGNVNFDTTTNHVTTSVGQTTTDDVKNLKSGLTSGGNLTVAAGKDITLAGTDVKATDASLDAGGNINVLTRQDTHQDVTRSNSSNGFSSSTTTVTNKSSTAVGSNLDIGGNLKTNSGGDTTIQGSQVNVAGNADIKTGGDLNIIAGQNTSEHTEETKSGGVGHNGNLYGSTDHTVDDTHTRSVASALNIGGNLNADVGKTLTVEGSNLNTKGDTTIAAQDVQVLAGTNTDTHTDKTVETKFGIFLGADGQASATGSGGANIKAKSANGGAQAGASGEVDVDFMRSQTDITQTRDVTHTASNLSTGGNLTIIAKNDLTTVGSNLAAGNDVNLQATNQSFTAAQDIHETTVSQSKTSAGLYLSGSAGGQAQGSGQQSGGQGGGGSGSGSASGSANVEAGLRGAHSEASVTTGSTTAQVSSITAGGNVNRNATGAITDVGTSIGAGGDLNQTATTYNALAAQNTTYTRSSAESDVAKVGISAEASGSAQGSRANPQDQAAKQDQAAGDAKGVTSGDALTTVGALGNAASMAGGGSPNGGAGSGSIGIAASFSQTKSDSTTGTSTAVVTNIKTGGNANLASKDKTTLEGANIASGGDTNITAGSLDFQAAKNTQTAASSGSSIDVSGRVGIVGSASLDLNAAVGTNSSTADASQAVVGQINSGGNLNVKTTQGDLRLEGTNINATGDTTLDSAGAVKFDAAHDTSSSADSSLSVAAGISASKGKGGSSGGAVQANVDVANAHTSEDNAVTGALNTGGNLTVKSATDTTFTGTALTAGGDASIAAGGNVNFNAATSTQHSDSLDVGAGIGLSKTGSGKNSGGKDQQGESSQSLSANVGIGKADATEQTGASLTTGGGFTIASGNDVNLQGTTLAAQGGGAINAARDVNATTIADTASALNVGVGVAVDRSTTNKAAKDANGNAIGKSAQQKNSDKIASNAAAKTAKGADAAMARNADAASANSASNLLAAPPEQTQGAPDNAALDKIVADNAAKKAAADKKAADAASPEGKAKAAATKAIGDKASAAVKKKLDERKAKAAAEAAKSPEQKAAEAKAKDDAKRAKMTPEQLAKDDKKKADAQAKADKKAASDAKKAEAAQAKADKKAAADQAKADKKAASDKVKADKKAASDAKKAEAAKAKADKKAADQAAKEAKMTPEQKAKSDAAKKAAADKKAASDAKKAASDAKKAEQKAASDKAKADKKAKADEQESKTTVGVTQSEFSNTSQTVTKAGSISGSGIVINAGRNSNLGGTSVSQTPAGASTPAPAPDGAGAPVGASLKALSKTTSVSNAQAKKAITDKKAADAKKAADKAAKDKADAAKPPT